MKSLKLIFIIAGLVLSINVNAASVWSSELFGSNTDAWTLHLISPEDGIPSSFTGVYLDNTTNDAITPQSLLQCTDYSLTCITTPTDVYDAYTVEDIFMLNEGNMFSDYTVYLSVYLYQPEGQHGFRANTNRASAIQVDLFDSNLTQLSLLHGGTTAPISFTMSATTVVPVPAAAWLFGSGLIGLIGVARRKKA
ncbi:MAG: VPLPA-CTERM sorting domain-containing protein [Gammaproteobacteria bacterium]|nr:VPLPA-CTERM sorting domain-containing protein [Gammaproteobacteria bacterium]